MTSVVTVINIYEDDRQQWIHLNCGHYIILDVNSKIKIGESINCEKCDKESIDDRLMNPNPIKHKIRYLLGVSLIEVVEIYHNDKLVDTIEDHYELDQKTFTLEQIEKVREKFERLKEELSK